MEGDRYCILADYASYVDCQEKVSQVYRDQEKWTKMAIFNVARSGKFSSDRAINEYAQNIWHITSVDIKPIDG
jgi:starch phosphorylase